MKSKNWLLLKPIRASTKVAIKPFSEVVQSFAKRQMNLIIITQKFPIYRRNKKGGMLLVHVFRS